MPRHLAIPRWKSNPKGTRLALSYLAGGPRSVHPALQDQRSQCDPTILDSTLGSQVADADPPSLVMERLRRMNNNQQLQNILNQASQLQDPRRRQQIFFDVPRRYARKNGSPVDFNDSLGVAVNTDEHGTANIWVRTSRARKRE